MPFPEIRPNVATIAPTYKAASEGQEHVLYVHILPESPNFTYPLKLTQLIIILQVALTVTEVTLEIFYRIEIIGIM